ncbi:RNA polymerase sigma factor [Globicatella sp. PHS-GS-PNBC-21-1553]|uniref:RNA polymerase sigma factor n=1 Tax=Globicatella sp. PHS-GS-PNBC-21-1553 TaxID=2885764 RepID=UPI00298F3E51|nr:sigma factor-like helix-turn-helix DNA-binding protein [Globicatella sp. PHS-GS-PNBC-21-1553]WPC09776.1 hypothetical protein LB888_08050 [Globicatella sp. PHS-GS-PNBC-21-1553]
MDVKLTNESLASKLEKVIAKLEEELLIKRKQMEELMQIINRLDELDQKIVKLKYVEGMTLEAVARSLGYSESHIKHRHAIVRQSLKFIQYYQDDITEYRADTL